MSGSLAGRFRGRVARVLAVGEGNRDAVLAALLGNAVPDVRSWGFKSWNGLCVLGGS